MDMSEKSPIFGATDSTNIEILDTSKIVIKSENITLYKGIFHLIDTFFVDNAISYHAV